MSERDTHFQNAAKLLWLEINEKGKFNIDMEAPDTDEIVTRLIARRAYDLAFYVVEQTTHMNEKIYLIPDSAILEKIPDFTEWPIDPGISRQIDRPS